MKQKLLAALAAVIVLSGTLISAASMVKAYALANIAAAVAQNYGG